MYQTCSSHKSSEFPSPPFGGRIGALSAPLWPAYRPWIAAARRTSAVTWRRRISSWIVRRWRIAGRREDQFSSGVSWIVAVIIPVWRIWIDHTGCFWYGHIAVISFICIQVNHSGGCIHRFWIACFAGINSPGIIIGVVIITIIILFAGIIVRAVVETVIIPEITPAVVTDAHSNFVVFCRFPPICHGLFLPFLFRPLRGNNRHHRVFGCFCKRCCNCLKPLQK